MREIPTLSMCRHTNEGIPSTEHVQMQHWACADIIMRGNLLTDMTNNTEDANTNWQCLHTFQRPKELLCKTLQWNGKKRNNKILGYKNNCYSGQWIRLLSNWCLIYSTRLIALISIRCKITDRNKDCLSFSKQQVQSLMYKIKEKQSCAERKHQGHTSQSCSPRTMYM